MYIYILTYILFWKSILCWKAHAQMFPRQKFTNNIQYTSRKNEKKVKYICLLPVRHDRLTFTISFACLVSEALNVLCLLQTSCFDRWIFLLLLPLPCPFMQTCVQALLHSSLKTIFKFCPMYRHYIAKSPYHTYIWWNLIPSLPLPYAGQLELGHLPLPLFFFFPSIISFPSFLAIGHSSHPLLISPSAGRDWETTLDNEKKKFFFRS